MSSSAQNEKKGTSEGKDKQVLTVNPVNDSTMDQQEQSGNYVTSPYQTASSDAVAGPGVPPGQLASHQSREQQQQQQQAQQLQAFWENQIKEIEKISNFKNHSLPLARVKRIMKADEDVRMVSAEATVVLERACEMFISELTLRSWSHTEHNKRRTLLKNDIVAAVSRNDAFDFLVDIVPRDVLGSIPREIVPEAPAVAVGYPYGYLPAVTAPIGNAGMVMGTPVGAYPPYPYPYMDQPMWPQEAPDQPVQPDQTDQPDPEN